MLSSKIKNKDTSCCWCLFLYKCYQFYFNIITTYLSIIKFIIRLLPYIIHLMLHLTISLKFLLNYQLFLVFRFINCTLYELTDFSPSQYAANIPSCFFIFSTYLGDIHSGNNPLFLLTNLSTDF